MYIKRGAMHFFFDGMLLGPTCNWIKLKVPLFLFDIYNDEVIVHPAPRWIGIIHNVTKIIIKATRCSISGRVIKGCVKCVHA